MALKAWPRAEGKPRCQRRLMLGNNAWPITHAILPRYLQLQFAKALYDARLQFARLQNPSPAAAGKLLASYAWDASSRFQEFLEQQELAGRIVLALLGQGAVKGQS